MKIGVAKETLKGECRVALVPTLVGALVKKGREVVIETGAGSLSGYPDSQYKERGAVLVSSPAEVYSQADVILQVQGLGANPEKGQETLGMMRTGQIVIAMLDPLWRPDCMEQLAQTGVSAFAMELMPRISRAQSMDVLSSMSTIAGYKGVLLAASELGKIFPMMMTAAGSLAPAKVLVIGAGVAGLQAIATAKRLGAVVSGYDVRAEVREQIESLGAKFVEMELDASEAKGQGGYAKEQSDAFLQRQREFMGKIVAESDVVVSTAAIPGRKSPVIITGEMVSQMADGSVIVDLAAERGGNCELTKLGETVVEHGVTILGPDNLASTIAYHASQMYAKNLVNFLDLLTTGLGELEINTDDECIRDTLITRDGQVINGRVKDALTSAAG
jgi:NAD(P) transhydrogenase subunit alpha